MLWSGETNDTESLNLVCARESLGPYEMRVTDLIDLISLAFFQLLSSLNPWKVDTIKSKMPTFELCSQIYPFLNDRLVVQPLLHYLALLKSV